MERLQTIDERSGGRTTTIMVQLARAIAGDQSAAGQLLVENRSWLRRKAGRRLSRRSRQHTHPSDLAQESLAAAAQGLGQFRGNNIQAFRAWLQTTLVNKFRSFLRRNRRRFEKQIRFPEVTDSQLIFAARQTSELVRLQRQEEIAHLAAALEELQADDRELILAHYLQDSPYSQLTERFGMNEQALWQKGRSAVAKLEAQRLLAAMHCRQLPRYFRKMLCAVRVRNWSEERIATEFGVPEHTICGFLERPRPG